MRAVAYLLFHKEGGPFHVWPLMLPQKEGQTFFFQINTPLDERERCIDTDRHSCTVVQQL